MGDYFKITVANGFHDLLREQFPHPLQRAIMPIILDRGGRPEVVGTAFAVGHRIALTAAHTFVMDGEPTGDGLRLVYLDGQNPDGSLSGGGLPIEKFTFDKDTDLAIMRFQMPIIVATGEEMTHKSLQISFDGPVIGDECVGIAYTVEQSFREDSDIPTFTVEPHLHFAPGSAFHLMDPAGVSHGPCLPARISSLRCTSLKSRVSHERWPPSC